MIYSLHLLGKLLTPISSKSVYTSSLLSSHCCFDVVMRKKCITYFFNHFTMNFVSSCISTLHLLAQVILTVLYYFSVIAILLVFVQPLPLSSWLLTSTNFSRLLLHDVWNFNASVFLWSRTHLLYPFTGYHFHDLIALLACFYSLKHSPHPFSSYFQVLLHFFNWQ